MAGERETGQGTQTSRRLPAAQVSQAPVNYFEATLAFGDLIPQEANANLTAFAETVMPVVRTVFAGTAFAERAVTR